MSLLFSYPPGCFAGRFVRRIKRFSVAFEYENQLLWAHTNNSGSMTGLLRQGYGVWVSQAQSKERKMPYTLEMINIAPPTNKTTSQLVTTNKAFSFPALDELPENQWVGVNTMAPNRLLKAAFYADRLPFAKGYTEFKPEAKHGDSRLDALLTGPGKKPLWVECKNVTLVEDGVAAFPDACTERGQKHVRKMIEIIKNGERAAFFYCIQRSDATCFGPADYIDPTYARLYYASLEIGVEVWPFIVLTSPLGLDLGPLLPLAPSP